MCVFVPLLGFHSFILICVFCLARAATSRVATPTTWPSCVRRKTCKTRAITNTVFAQDWAPWATLWGSVVVAYTREVFACAAQRPWPLTRKVSCRGLLKLFNIFQRVLFLISVCLSVCRFVCLCVCCAVYGVAYLHFFLLNNPSSFCMCCALFIYWHPVLLFIIIYPVRHAHTNINFQKSK